MHFTRLSVAAAGLLLSPALVRARTLMRRGVTCSFEIPADSGDTCESLASSWGISVDDFIKINPGVVCPNLQAGKSYCVLGDWTPDTTTTSTSTTSTTIIESSTTTTTTPPSTTAPASTTSTTTTTAPSNSPTMPGVAANCDRFHLVESGDTCDAIASSSGITSAQLRAWNTEINAACSNLWLDYYICTRVPGATTPSNSPPLPGAAANCEKWYQIVSGDTCDTVAAKNTITVDQLRSMNTGIDSTCDGLSLGYFACVSVPGTATPMPSIVSGCSRYSLVVPNDNCDVIASRYGITVADFKRWNQYIDSGCTNLWLGALVCTNA